VRSTKNATLICVLQRRILFAKSEQGDLSNEQKRKIGKWCGEIKEEVSNESKDAKGKEGRARK
jgi:hypothetical protein